MNILYCGDENIADGLLVSILSLLKNVEETLHIYVLTMSDKEKTYHPVADGTIKFLDGSVKKKYPDGFVKKVDVTDLFYSCVPTVNMKTRFTPYCMLRLYADQVEGLPDHIMYLDSDVVCRKDPSQFYYQNMDGVEVAGVLDYYGSWFFRRKFWKRDYLNSGVLLLNLAEIKKNGLFEKCRQRCQSKRMFMPDQSAINKLSLEKRKCKRYYNEQRRIKKTTVFQHFTTSFRFFPWVHTLTVKPWQVDQVHEKLKLHEYDDILSAYEDMAPAMRA